MKIRFDPDFDGGAWPGALHEREAVAGEAWLGELGLLDRLETVLGLNGSVPTASERAASLVPALRQHEGFWSRSVEVDPLGSARELLRWRDELALAGWLGDAVGAPDRVAALAQLSVDVLPGLPDRIWQVCDTLARRAGEVATLELLEPLEFLPLAWQRLISALENQGTTLCEIPLEPAPATGDLAGARAAGLHPQLDGSLQLLRPDGPWSAAVEVAAWLASRDSYDGVVFISPTPLLDTELRRFGLPTTGAKQTRGGSTVLEVLPLVLALGWKLAAPEDVAALLSLPQSPVPRGIANRLRGALAQWPAVGSGEWKQAVASGLEAIEDSSRRARVSERLRGIFEGSVERTGPGYPVEEIRKRTALVRDWLRGRRATLDDAANTDLARALDEAVGQCMAFERIVELAGLERWGAADLQRFLDEARASSSGERVLAAEAGVASVASPGAIAGAARCVVWWDFSRQSAPRHARIPFTNAERAQLADAGITLPTPAERAVRQAQRWRRPLDQATEALLLVSPRTTEAGDESHPHPLWDEIGARLEKIERLERPERGDGAGQAEHSDQSDRQARNNRDVFMAGALYAAPRPTRSAQPLRPPPVPLREWTVSPDLLPLPEHMSNSALEDLVRCSLKWALGRVAYLKAPETTEVGIPPRVLGQLAHSLLEEVLPVAGGDPAQAKSLAEQWFDENTPTRVAALYLPGRDADRSRVRRIAVDAAELFSEFARDAGLTLRFTEQKVEGTGLGRKLFGFPDLVLGPKPVVVDAKWGGLSYRRDALKKGTATQLAFYAHLLGQQEGFDEAAASVAFFVLSRGQILTTDPDLGMRAEAVEGPSHAETWQALERAFDARKAEIARGQLFATANPDELGQAVAKDEVNDEGAVVLKPNCHWCDYGGLCGAGLPEAGS